MTNAWRVWMSVAVLLCVLTGCVPQQKQVDVAICENLQGKDLRDIVGVSHVIGRYYFTEKDFLNEGADEILDMGSRVIKVWFYCGDETPELYYPYNSQWPGVESLVEGAQTPYWKALFDKPFSTYLLYHQSMGLPGYYFKHGVSDEQAAEDERQTYELAKHFLTEYQGTGKTFIFCSSEIDWHLMDEPIDADKEIPEERFGYLEKWLNARQAGVEKARREVGMHGVQVYHASEMVNVLHRRDQGLPTVAEKVLPNVYLDLVGYSAYDSTVYGGVQDAAKLREALDYIASKAQPSKYFGGKNVFVAEWGIPENEFSQEDVKKLTHNVIETCLEWGCPYIVHWQLYCNENNGTDRVWYQEFADHPCWDADKFRGFWLIRPDGTKNYIYHYLEELCKTNTLPKYEPDENARFSYRPISDIVGSTHVKSNYYFGDEDSLNEGADRLLEMGTKVVKVWLSMGKGETPQAMYPWNSDWPTFTSLVEVASHPYWREFFHKPFKTYIMNVMEMVPMENYYWREHFTAEQEAEVERQMYELAKHFLAEYQGTGKTFILSNHESDWHIKGVADWDAEAPEHATENAIRWFNARQRGVQKARMEMGMTPGVQVLHAGEVVHVVKSMKEGQKNMVNQILPHVNFDLVSYSCWDSTIIGGIQGMDLITEALDYIEENLYKMENAEGDTAKNNYFGKKRVFIGEFGLPENDYNEALVLGLTQNVVEKGLEWGCPYIVYWQLYCNEPRPGVELPSRDNEDSRGFWLIGADGSRTATYDYLKQLMRE